MKIEEKDEFEENSGFNSSSGRRNMSGSGRHDRGDVNILCYLIFPSIVVSESVCGFQRETEQHRKLFIGGLT